MKKHNSRNLKNLVCGIAFLLFSPLTGRADVAVSIGTLQPGDSVTITYEVTIDNPIAPGVTQISSQGTVSGSNFSTVSTDDPETIAADDATVTILSSSLAVMDTVLRPPDGDVKVKVATLLANDTDPENDTLTITGVSSPTPAGASVTLSGEWIYYTHNGTTPGSFIYTITDGHGSSVNGLVNVNIQGLDTQSSTEIDIVVDGSGAHLTFNGIPGRSYVIQFRDTLGDPWVDQGTASASLLGLFHYDDPAGTPTRFYRYVYR